MSDNITSVLNEDRMFPPPEAFQSQALIKSIEEYERLWEFSVNNSEEFWHGQETDLLEWHKPFEKVLEWEEPYAKWFTGGKINACYNCVDRHLENDADKTA